uniref:Ubiquitin specific peptidase 34 n=1 Tax=Nothobranchius kuhntae TaxID=321403 RepID=A0A1A8HWD2_NOTKU
MEEREKLLLCAAKIFQIQFPLYTAYKHNTHPTLEDISAHESNILGSFCDMNDVEVPLHLLRYVCLFCGKHGLSLMKECFERGTPESLPFPIAHAFITIVSNIRIWLHIPAVMQHIIPFRTYVIRYLCKLSDQELRQSAARNMADLMWSTVKEPLDSALCFDKESLDLAFKYFMSPTLTMRLAGLSQITNQLHTFNDVCNNESLVSDTETSIAKELGDWLIHNNVVEHIFGPNLHIEIIKQCQVILNFLAAEGRLSTPHIDCIWAAAQLKHCSRYIHDLFPSLIKNLDPVPLRHVLNLVSGLHPSAHTEQTLYLASMLIKALWNNALAAKAQLSKQSSFASLLNTNVPMGNKKGSPAASPDSSDNSDTQQSGGSDMEMEDQMMVTSSKRSQQRLSDTEESLQGSSDETANSVEEGSSGPGSSSASSSLEGRMRMLDACSSSSSARPERMEPQQQAEDISPSQMVIEYNPSQCLDWLAVQTPRNKLAHSWVLQNMENWVERFLLAHNYPRVRTSAAYLLVSLIPSNSFRQMFRSTRSLHLPTRELPLSPDTTVVLHQVYNLLLGLLGRAKLYVDASVHGTTKLVQYFSFMTYCLISKTEKLMFSGYFMDLWNLFQPKLSEPAIATNHNKQALLSFWYNVCVDCPENVRLVVQNPVVTKNIAFNYILADHDDQEVVLFNRGMLPAYYGILRMCCEQSPVFTRQLASHQNIQWAFKNLTPHASQYPGAVEELFNLMQLFVARADMREEELEDIKQFKKTTISCYLRCLDGRSCWTTLISAFRILLENDEDRLLVVFNRGLILMTESFNTLHMMYHEATACHVTGDLVELLSIFLSVLKATRPYLQRKDVKQALIQWQERIDFAHKLLTLLNSYSPPELRSGCLDVLKELVLLSPHDFLHTLVPFLQHNHCTYHHSNIPMSFGPYLPCRENIKLMGAKNNVRPPRPELNMCLLPSLVESSKGKDDIYDRVLLDYFLPYHQFIHLLCRVAINCEKFTDALIKLSVLIAYEGLPLHLALFPKLWTDLCQSQSVMAKTCVKLLCEDPAFSEYIKCILMDERTFLNNNVAYSFLTCFLHKVQVLSGPSCSSLIGVLVTNLLSEQNNLQPEPAVHRVELNKTSSLLNADLRALVLLLSIQPPQTVDPGLCPALQELLGRCRLCLQQRSTVELEAKDHKSKAEDEGATPVKRRRVSGEEDRAGDSPLCVASTSSSALPGCSDLKPDHQEALTPTSTSDTETRDSSLIDPGTEQDPPSPDSAPTTSRNLDSSLKEDKMEVSSSSSSSFSSSSSSSLLQEAGEGEGTEPLQQHVGTAEEQDEKQQLEERRGEGTSTSSEEVKEEKAGCKASRGSTPSLSEEAAFPSALGLVGEGPDSRGDHASSSQVSPPDMLDMLYRTVEATIAIVTKLSSNGSPAS